MPSRVEFSRLAELELEDAVAFYEAEAPGKGLALARNVETIVAQAMVFPSSGSPITGLGLGADVRRYLLNPAFPYHVVASAMADLLLVLAVAHQKRDPDYWVAPMPRG